MTPTNHSSLFAESSPCLAKHGHGAYDHALRAMGGELAATPIRGRPGILAMDSVASVLEPLRAWFGGGEPETLQSAIEQAPLALKMISSLCTANGEIIDEMVSLTALLATLAGDTQVPPRYRAAVMDRLSLPADADGDMVRASSINALDLSCGTLGDVSDRVFTRLEVAKTIGDTTAESAVFLVALRLQLACANKIGWPGAAVRRAQFIMAAPESTFEYRRVWDVCVFQAAILSGRFNGLLPGGRVEG